MTDCIIRGSAARARHFLSWLATQGTTYHYGNVFRPLNQRPFPRDEWFFVELEAKANTVGHSHGRLALWVNDVAVGAYSPGYPDGTWLRDSFREGGCSYSACTPPFPPVPLEGFDFRTNAVVLFKEACLDAYSERDSSASKRAELEALGFTVSGE
jgi:hypothetical protein